MLNEKQHRKWCYSLDPIFDLSPQEPDPETTDVADCGLLLSRMLITVQTSSYCAAPGTDAGASLEARVTMSVVRSLLTKITLSEVSVLAS